MVFGCLAGKSRSAGMRLSKDLRRAIEHAARNIRAVAEKQLPRGWAFEVEAGVSISQIVRPVEAIGCYIPGRAIFILSTLLMTVIPAMVAGVKRITVVSPSANAALLAAAEHSGSYARRKNRRGASYRGAGLRHQKCCAQWIKFLVPAIAS